MTRYFWGPNFFGFLGSSKVERIADRIIPTKARVINVLVTNGKLVDRVVTLKLSPPRSIGIQPITPIMRALVAQE